MARWFGNPSSITLLSCGGSISHHHGIGKAKAGLLMTQSSSPTRLMMTEMKKAIDPSNVFAVNNGLLVCDDKAEVGEEEESVKE